MFVSQLHPRLGVVAKLAATGLTPAQRCQTLRLAL